MKRFDLIITLVFLVLLAACSGFRSTQKSESDVVIDAKKSEKSGEKDKSFWDGWSRKAPSTSQDM